MCIVWLKKKFIELECKRKPQLVNWNVLLAVFYPNLTRAKQEIYLIHYFVHKYIS